MHNKYVSLVLGIFITIIFLLKIVKCQLIIVNFQLIVLKDEGSPSENNFDREIQNLLA